MNSQPRRKFGRVVAGSLSAAAVVALLAPLNMGGCSNNPGSAISSATGSIAQGKAPGLGDVGEAVGGSHGRALGDASQDVIKTSALTPADEVAIGQSVALAVSDKYGLVEDDALNEYVTLVAQTLADSAPGDLRPVAFVLNTDVVNAFSGPRGYIMITRGALRRMQDESELAGLLAHEMGHVIEQHGINAIKSASRTNLIAKGLSTAVDSKTHVQAIGSLSTSFVKEVLDKGYSRGQESEADTDAVRLVAAAGYDPQGYVRFLQRAEAAQRGGSNLFSTHPGLSDRVRAVTSQIDRENLGGQGQTNRERFQAAVGGGGGAGAGAQGARSSASRGSSDGATGTPERMEIDGSRSGCHELTHSPVFATRAPHVPSKTRGRVGRALPAAVRG